MVTIYTSPTCPACKVLKSKLDSKGISYTEETDLSKLEENNIVTLPVLEVDGKLLTIGAANSWINAQ